MSVKDVLKFAADEKTAYVNVRFTDLVGAWHHLTFPIDELSEKSFEDGFGFDGSSLRGWASIHESDMLLVPDPYRYWIDPFMDEKTLRSEEHTSELQSLAYLVCRLLLEKKKA